MIYNSNADHAGMIMFDTFSRMNEKHELEVAESFETWYFEDKNGNGDPDEDEPFVEEGTRFFLNGEEVTADTSSSLNVEGEYQLLVGTKTSAEMLELLQGSGATV